jgi:hypothetical protein
MKKALLLCFLWGSCGFAAESFETVRPGDVVLFFGSPIGLVAETSPYSERTMRVRLYYYLVHPLEMRLEGSNRGLASDEVKDELFQLPLYELSRYGLWMPENESSE